MYSNTRRNRLSAFWYFRLQLSAIARIESIRPDTKSFTEGQLLNNFVSFPSLFFDDVINFSGLTPPIIVRQTRQFSYDVSFDFYSIITYFVHLYIDLFLFLCDPALYKSHVYLHFFPFKFCFTLLIR